MLLMEGNFLQSIIYYAVSSPKLEEWIDSTAIRDALQPLKDKNFVDLFPVEKLVYLSPHSETELETYDEDSVYVVG